MSPFKLFCDRWKGGCRSGLCADALSICLSRGVLPCDILFIGEAPGDCENALGEPFIGPAGHELDKWIIQAGLDKYRLAWTNLVCCMPQDEETGKIRKPEPEEVISCAPRLEEFVRIAKPRVIICVGGLSERYIVSSHRLLSKYECHKVGIIHPAAILRAGKSSGDGRVLNPAAKSFHVRKAVLAMIDAAEVLK